MKNFQTGMMLVLGMAFTQPVLAQFTFPKANADANPFSRRTELRGNSEVYFVYDSLDQNTNTYIPKQQIIDHSYTSPNNWDWNPNYQNGVNNEANRHIAVAKGDFNGDYLDDIVQAWQGPSRNIVINIPA